MPSQGPGWVSMDHLVSRAAQVPFLLSPGLHQKAFFMEHTVLVN